jgi:hypothetical protein
MVYDNTCVKKLVTFVAAVFRMAAMLRKMAAAVSGCVSTSHTSSARKRNPTILLKFTDNHRSAPVGGTLGPYLYRTDRIDTIRRAGPDLVE